MFTFLLRNSLIHLFVHLDCLFFGCLIFLKVPYVLCRVSDLTLRSLIYLELGTLVDRDLISDIQFLQHHLLEKLFFFFQCMF